MPFVRSYDDILDEILTIYRNNLPDIDLTHGSLGHLKSTVMAGAVYNLYRYQGYIANQIFPNTADIDNMEKWAWIWGITRRPEESDQDLLARLLSQIRTPLDGGNANDYRVWAESVPGIAFAKVYPLRQGLGTVDIVVSADISTGSEIPTTEKVQEVQDYIDLQRPVTAKWSIVFPVGIQTQDVDMNVWGQNLDINRIKTDVENFLNSLEPDEILYTAALIGIAQLNDTDNAVVNVPASDVTPAQNNMIRAGAVTINWQTS